MGDRGYGSILALGLLFGGVLLVGIASDVARLASAWQDASHVAHTAAEVAAGWVDAPSLYGGRLEIDRPAARSAALAYIDVSGFDGQVRITGARVCVTARTSVHSGLARLVGGGMHVVSVTACAEPRQG